MTDLEQTQSDLKPKIKVVLFPEIGQVKDFLSLTRPHSRMRIRIYNFNLKEEKKKRENKKSKRNQRRIQNICGKSNEIC